MQPITLASEHRIRVPEGTLVVLSGLPGSGKSYLRTHRTLRADMATWLSSDALRDEISPPQQFLLKGRPRMRRNESANDAVFAILLARVRAGLAMGRTVVVDATNLTDADRGTWVAVADELGVPHLVLILGVPLDTCIERAASREFHVPESTIRAMHQPPIPVISEKILDKARRTGVHVPATAPQGFQLTSRFTHQVINDNAIIEFTSKELPDGLWDVVGDTHGLLDDLLVLLAKAGWRVGNGRLTPHRAGRKLLFLGDLVDRGTQSIEMVRFVMRAVNDGLALCLKGNHEDKLVRFLRQAQSEGIERWSSFANAETGMNFLKLEARELAELTRFLNHLPTYLVDTTSSTAFVHADVHVFCPGEVLTSDTVYGMSGWKKMDSDALYQEGFDFGINHFTVVRGHFPETSEQGSIFSLERHPFQKGELVLMHFDQVQAVFSDRCSSKESRREAFNRSLVTQRCEFDFEAYSTRYDLIKGMESLQEGKHVTKAMDDSKMLRVYKYSKQTFFNNAWGESPLLLKARGLVLDVAGTIVSHPFDKVFNYLENGIGKDLSDDAPVVVPDKLNGFLGIISAHPLQRGELLVHTQGSFGGDFVGYIKDYLSPSLKGQILKYLSRNDVTLAFEVLHASDPHIIEYPAAMLGLHLIGVRGKQVADKSWREDLVDNAASEMGLRRPGWQRMTFGQAREVVRTTMTEGLMIRADNEDQDFLLKMKSPYYLSTKFLGRLSSGKIKHLFSNPKDFKKNLDEEFFILVDAIVGAYSAEQFAGFTDDERVVEVRKLINKLQ